MFWFKPRKTCQATAINKMFRFRNNIDKFLNHGVCSITFKLEDGSIQDFKVSDRIYYHTKIGDKCLVTIQGKYLYDLRNNSTPYFN